MRVLLVSYSYFPAPSPRAFRWTAIAEHWASRGWQVDVVTAWMPGMPRVEVRNGVSLHRVGRARLGWTPGARGTAGAGQTGRRWSPVPLARAVAKRVHALTWKRLYWPDYTAVWYFSAKARVLELARLHQYDALISSSVPFNCHLVAEQVKLRSPALRWLVDVGDPFSFMDSTPTNNHRLYGRLNYRVESRVLDRADAVSVTTETTRDRYAMLFPRSAGKIRVVPPMLSLPEAVVGEAEPPASAGRIRLLFVGTLYRGIRSPAFLLRLFAELEKTALGSRLELHFFGNVHDAEACFAPYPHLLGQSIFLQGVVPRERVARAMRQAQCLVNIGNSTVYQLPSKVVEYAALGKPILNLVSTPEDSSIAFFARHPGALTLLDDAGGVPTPEQVRATVSLLADPPAIHRAEVDEWLAPFRLEAVARGYEELLA